MMFQARWQKLRPTALTRSRLDQAVAEFNRRFGVDTHLVRHPFGKLLIFQAGNLWVTPISSGGRPPRFGIVGMIDGAEPRFLFPEQNEADFRSCCDLVGAADEADRNALHRFLFPQAGRSAARSASGVV